MREWFRAWRRSLPPWKRACLSVVVGVGGYAVMPQGPWYREVGAALLIIWSHRIWEGLEW